MRAGARALMRRAAEAGVREAWKLLRLAPAEIELEMRARAAEKQRAAEQADLLAFLTGRYVLIGLHAPRRYPKKPDAVRRPPREMCPSEMKRAFAAMAAGREAERDDC